MKNLILLLAIFTLVSCGNKNKDLDRFRLKGNVSSVCAKTYRADSKFGEITKGEVDNSGYKSNQLITFNEKGKILKIDSFNEDGELVSRDDYKYNDDLLENIIIYDSEGKLDAKFVYKYDGDIISEVKCYDKKGNLIQKIEYVNDGTHNIECKCYDGNSDNENLRGEKDSLTLTSEYKYFYDGDKLVEIQEKKNGGEFSTFVSNVYEGDNLVKSNFNGNESLIFYDSDNMVNETHNIEVSVFDDFTFGGDETHYYSYKLDNHGNWIERIDYKGETKIPDKIVERKIEYFD